MIFEFPTNQINMSSSPAEALIVRLKICLDICSAMLYLSNKSIVSIFNGFG